MGSDAESRAVVVTRCAAAERHLQASALSWVIVRPVGLMAAALSWRDDIETGVIRHPHITAGYPHVHEDDIADVVVRCLAVDDYVGQKLMATSTKLPKSVTQSHE